MTDLKPYQGGRRAIRVAFLAGAGCLILTLLGTIFWPRQSLYSYLGAYSYWCSIAVGALIWLMAFQAASTRWSVVIRRPLEMMSGNGVILGVLFIPIAIGMNKLYPWVSPEAARGAHYLELMRHKAAWLNPGAFVARAVVYFAVFAFFGNLLIRYSHRLDETGAVGWRLRMRQVASGGLPAVGLCATFASFDWIMSLEPTWYSTIFGIYWFAGGFVAASALWILLVAALDLGGPLGGLVSPSHYHSMGKLMFAFLCFWAYIGFAQLLLIWIANLPEEITFYSLRRHGGWLTVSVFLIVGHFAVPFIILLSRDLKRSPTRLSWMAVWVLIVHWVDSWWLVMPALRPTPRIGWQDVTATIGIGGLVFAYGLQRFRGRLPAPAGDPYFEESLRYNK